MRLKSPSSPWPTASCSMTPGQPAPSTMSKTPAGAGTASRLTSAWRSASSAIDFQLASTKNSPKPVRPPAPCEPVSCRSPSAGDDGDVDAHQRPDVAGEAPVGAQDLDRLPLRAERHGDLAHRLVLGAEIGVDLLEELHLGLEAGRGDRVLLAVELLIRAGRRRRRPCRCGRSSPPRRRRRRGAARPPTDRPHGRSRSPRRRRRAGRSPGRRKRCRPSGGRCRRTSDSCSRTSRNSSPSSAPDRVVAENPVDLGARDVEALDQRSGHGGVLQVRRRERRVEGRRGRGP